MKVTFRVLLVIFLVCILLSACAKPKAVLIGGDTYLLTRTDYSGIFGNFSAFKAEVIEDANKFAASQGKVLVPVSQSEVTMIPGRQLGSFDYTFRLVDPNSSAAKPQLSIAEQFSSFKDRLDAAAKKRNECNDATERTQEAIRLSEKYIINIEQDTKIFAKKLIGEYVSEQEKADHIKLREYKQECINDSINELNQINTRLANFTSHMINISDENLIKLINKNITIGEFNKNKMDISAYGRQEQTKLLEDISESYKNAHNEEISAVNERLKVQAQAQQASAQEQQANTQAYNSFMQTNLQQQALRQQQQQIDQQKYLNIFPKTTTTDCNFVGNTLSCTSR